MKAKCVVCHKVKVPGEGRPFHRFPSADLQKRIWLSALNIPSAPKSALVCCNHFDARDYIVARDGGRRLKPDAVPNLLGPPYASSDSTDSEDDKIFSDNGRASPLGGEESLAVSESSIEQKGPESEDIVVVPEEEPINLLELAEKLAEDDLRTRKYDIEESSSLEKSKSVVIKRIRFDDLIRKPKAISRVRKVSESSSSDTVTAEEFEDGDVLESIPAVSSVATRENPMTSTKRFPADREKRKIWMSLTRLDPDESLPKNIYLCSSHFDPKDIIISPLEKRFLVSGATPRSHDACDSSSFGYEPTYTPDDSSSESPQIKEEPQDLQYDNSIPTQVAIAGSSGLPSTLDESTPNLEQIKIEPGEIKKEPEDTRYDDLIASAEKYFASKPHVAGRSNPPFPEIETEEDVQQYQSFTSSEKERDLEEEEEDLERSTKRAKRKRMKRKCYLGDLTVEDFSTPDKIIKHLETIRKRDAALRREKHNLQMSLRRVKLRVNKLTTVIDHLVNSNDNV